jgi:hypothetical protein
MLVMKVTIVRLLMVNGSNESDHGKVTNGKC